MDNNFENRLQAIEYELSQVAESEYLDELRKKFTADEDIGVVVNIITPKNIVFKTRSLLSQILNRLELTHQDRLDLEKYIVYGGGDNIEYIKQTLAIWLEWKDKIFNIIKDAPEEFDTLIEVFNYINKHIEESTIELQNIPFEKGSVDNSAVLKGRNNQVISESGVALGSNNIAGLKGFYYKSIKFLDSERANIYITKTQQVPTIIDDSPAMEDVPISQYLNIGDIISIVNDSKYDNCAEIITFLSNDKGIRVKWVDEQPFNKVNTDDELNSSIFDPEDYSIYCLSKPNAGIADIGQASFVSGYNNKATNGKATAFGYNNHAYGKFSFVEGRDNEAAYAAHAEGRENIASGEQSHVEGRNTIASGNCSHAEGRNTVSSGINSHAEGEGIIVGGVVSLNVGAHGRSSHVEGIATTTGEYNEQTGVWSKGDAAHAEGNNTIASGNHSHAEGSGTQAIGWQSHAEGHNTVAKGNRSHAEGSGTKTHNLAEHAQGSFNKSTESTDKSKATQFSIGIGTSTTNRKNAVEVKQNGDTYIIGIGGFTGTNTDSSKSVQEVINELVNKLNEITTND